MIKELSTDELCHEIIGASMEVHNALGPGLLEKIYMQCLCKELELRNIPFVCEFVIPLIYKGLKLETEFMADLLVDDRVIVELKAVTEMNPVYEAQLISYLTLAGKPTGLLINFTVPSLRNGIKRLFPKGHFHHE